MEMEKLQKKMKAKQNKYLNEESNHRILYSHTLTRMPVHQSYLNYSLWFLTWEPLLLGAATELNDISRVVAHINRFVWSELATKPDVPISYKITLDLIETFPIR